MVHTNYSGSKCPSCQGSSFEVVVETPADSNFKLGFVKCSTCKTVVGTQDYYNVGSLVHKIMQFFKIPD